MVDFENDLYNAIAVCNGNLNYCSKIHKIYTFTTENISGYLKYFDLKDKSLLTVGSSGDQLLNAYYNGARDITLYDINSYSKYYTFLKISAIISLNYVEFLEFFLLHGLDEYYNKKRFSSSLFNKIKPTLRLFDYESFLFFDELFSLYDVKTIIDYLFDDDECRNRVIMNFNTYLKDEESYNRLKSILKSISFKYVNGDIFKDGIDGKFDNIILSNLCTITNIDKLKELISKIDKNNLKDSGSLLLGYLWYISFDETNYKDDWAEIYKVPITKEKLKDYITEYHSINSGTDYLWDRDDKDDLVLIYRK